MGAKSNLFESDHNINLVFNELRDQFDDHLDSINQNTNEIAQNHEYLCEIDYKINKLSERLESLQLFLESKMGFKREQIPLFNPKSLTSNEQDVFLVLYMLEENKGAVSYIDIAKRTGLSEDLIASYITRMVEKNIPIIKRYVNNKPLLRLDPQFKRLQAKENILKLNQRTMDSFQKF